MNTRYRDGEHSSHGVKLLAAWMAIYSEYCKNGVMKHPRSGRALKGWKRMVPGRTRKPCPFPCGGQPGDGADPPGRAGSGPVGAGGSRLLPQALRVPGDPARGPHRPRDASLQLLGPAGGTRGARGADQCGRAPSTTACCGTHPTSSS
eukprot:3001359-Pyramimonas_sp.AAC.1